MGEIEERRRYTEKQIQLLRNKLGTAKRLLGDNACVYATGSFGRLEASKSSDLDLFIVSKSKAGSNGTKESRLSRLDEICIKAELIEAVRKLKIPDFDGDGRYLAHYTVDHFTGKLGTPEDDVENTLTGRLLLFLESKPLLGEKTYKDIIHEVIAAYWRDYEDHKASFMPAFLANDILRLWRTFCVNYEARTKREPEDKKIKGKIKNYKLKHSRILTCYSALLYLLYVYIDKGTVSPDNAIEMTRLTPTERLSWLGNQDKKGIGEKVKNLLDQYERFLVNTNPESKDLSSVFADSKQSKVYMDESYLFGDLMYETLLKIGGKNKFYRLIVV